MIWFRAFILMCTCVTLEVSFNAIRRLLWHRRSNGMGEISVVMLPIYYFGIGFALVWFGGHLAGWNWAARGLGYAVGIMAFEWCAATVLYRFGIRAWVYTRGWHIQGKVRLDYIFYWWVFGVAFDAFNSLLVRLLP